jgi:hypothetical protein
MSVEHLYLLCFEDGMRYVGLSPSPDAELHWHCAGKVEATRGRRVCAEHGAIILKRNATEEDLRRRIIHEMVISGSVQLVRGDECEQRELSAEETVWYTMKCMDYKKTIGVSNLSKSTRSLK